MCQKRRQIEELRANRDVPDPGYLARSMNVGVLRDAVNRGFVSEDGSLTRKGQNFLVEASTSTSVGE